MQTITVVNRKGGVGKSTSAATLACVLAEQGLRVLAIDCDSQANLGKCLGVEVDPRRTLSRALDDVELGVDELTTQLSYEPRVRLLAGDGQLVRTEQALQGSAGGDRYLRLLLAEMGESFDVAILDTPPSMGMLTRAALTAADWALVVSEPTVLALEGTAEALGVIEKLREVGSAPDLKLLGLLLTMVNERLRLTREVRDLCTADGVRLLEPAIPDTVRVAEAPAYGKPILYTANDDAGRAAAAAYRQLGSNITKICGLTKPAQALVA